MEFSDPLLDPNILSRLKIISDCRERFELSETGEERQFQAHLALDEYSHLFRELCDWSLEYRVGLTKLWSEGTPVSSVQPPLYVPRCRRVSGTGGLMFSA